MQQTNTLSDCFIQLLHSLMMDQSGAKHVGVNSYYNNTANLIQFCAFVGLNYSK